MPTMAGETAQLILHWFHIIAGIAEALLFFNLINVPFMKQVNAPRQKFSEQPCPPWI